VSVTKQTKWHEQNTIMSTNNQAQVAITAQSMQHKPVALEFASRCQSPSESLQRNHSNDNQV
jgi:hypothetical protein